MKRKFNEKPQSAKSGLITAGFLILFIIVFAYLMSACNMTNTKNTVKDFDSTGKIVQKETVKEAYFMTSYKFLSFELNVYALAASFVDPSTGNFSPYLKVGIFTEKYKSYPVTPGQGIVIVDEEYSTSWWNWTTFFNGTPDTKTNLVRRTIIVISDTPDNKKVLNVDNSSGSGVTIDSDGITIPKKLKVNLK